MMKRIILSFALLLFVLSSISQNKKVITKHNKHRTINFMEIANGDDPMAVMSNIHRHPDPPKTKEFKNAATTQMIRQSLGAAPQPRLITTIAPGFNHDGGYPYDNGIAVSNRGQVVTTTNQGVYIYDIGNTLNYSTGYNSFLASPGGKFDPQIAYDSHNQRYVVIILRTGVGNVAGLDIAVSTSNNPTGLWHSYFVPNSNPNTNSWVDFPHLGVSSERMYVHANIHDGPRYLESAIWDIPLDSLYAGGQITVTRHSTQQGGIRFVPGATGVYGDKIYGIEINYSTFINLYSFSDGNMEGPFTLTTPDRSVSTLFETNGRLIFPGGDSDKAPTYLKDTTIYYATPGAFSYDKTDTTMLSFGKIILDTDDLGASTVTTPHYIRDGMRNFAYVSMVYAGYDDDEGNPGSLITALYGSPTEYLGTIAYHVDPDNNVSDPLIIAAGAAHVGERIGDYIQAVYDPSGTREVWISGQFGSTSASTSIYPGDSNNLLLGNIIAKIQVDEPTSTSTPIINTNKEMIFPNPARNFTSFKFTAEAHDIYEARLFGTDGKQKALLTSRRLKPGPANLSFDISRFESGLYLVVITNSKNKKIATHKLSIK